VKLGLSSWQSDVDNGRIESDHQLGDTHNYEHPPTA